MSHGFEKDNVFVVLSLSGGNDGLNTVIPYTNGLYRDYRPHLGIPADQVLPINNELGFHPTMAPLKQFWDEGKLAIFLGIGYPTSELFPLPLYGHLAHLRAGQDRHRRLAGPALKEIDPNADNVLTGVNFGRGLPRALAKEGVPVASVGNLETYGLLTGIEGQDQRTQALDVFASMYGPTLGTGYAINYIRRTGTDALKGADILATAPSKYTSNVTYNNTAVGQYMKNIAQTHLANFGTRVLYTTSPYNGFDTHASEAVNACQAVDGCVGNCQDVLRRPAAAPGQRQCAAVHVLRVRPSYC